MASQAFKDLKLGFMVAAGFFVFTVVLSIFLALSMRAMGE
jgi:hypothetical protein